MYFVLENGILVVKHWSDESFFNSASEYITNNKDAIILVLNNDDKFDLSVYANIKNFDNSVHIVLTYESLSGDMKCIPVEKNIDIDIESTDLVRIMFFEVLSEFEVLEYTPINVALTISKISKLLCFKDGMLRKL